MRIFLRGAGLEVELVPRDQVLEIRSEAAALQFLRGFAGDPVNLAALRQTVDPGGWPRLDDAEVLRRAARRLAAGELKAVARRRFAGTPEVGESGGAAASTPRQDEAAAAAAAPAAEPAPAAAAAAASDAATEDPLLPATVDAAAQAATLQEAAVAGAPLCDT